MIEELVRDSGSNRDINTLINEKHEHNRINETLCSD